MKHRILAVSSILFILVFGSARSRAQSSGPAQASATAATPAPVHRILTKDREYLSLLSPPMDNEFLQAYSNGYREKAAEIEAKVADFPDANPRNEARKNEWARVSKREQDKFRYEAEVAFNDAKISFLQRHPDGLFEVGRVSYDENNKSLVVQPTPTAPLDANFRVLMNSATLNQIYDKFRQIVAQEIDQKARDYVSKASPGSTCARNPDLCFKFDKDEVERSLRAERIVVVAGGDFANRKIDHLLLVDYDTEAVLTDLAPSISSLSHVPWRFSIEEVPPLPAEAVSAESQPEGSVGGNTGESSSNMPASSTPLPNRIRIPDNVTAASIISKTKPQYPLQARASHIQGDVFLHAIIDKEGKISEVQILSGDDLLAQSALEAVRQWRYKPILINGEPTEVDTTIIVTFSLLD